MRHELAFLRRPRPVPNDVLRALCHRGRLAEQQEQNKN
jgi:hypothetical protein